MVSDMQNKAQEAISEVQAQLQEQEDAIEAARQEALEEAGFNQDETEEGLEAQVEAAKESGDKVLEYQKNRQLQEKQINDKYDAQAEAATKAAEKKKAEIQYNADKAQWASQIVQGIANTAAAVVSVLAGQPGGLVSKTAAAIVVGAMGAAQTAMIAANPPKMPAFADGGAFTNRVVSRPTEFDMGLMGEAGPEAVMPLTRTADGSLGVRADGGGNTNSASFTLVFDGDVFARVMVDHINSGENLIDFTRGVING
jgi:hypothetical protein